MRPLHCSGQWTEVTGDKGQTSESHKSASKQFNEYFERRVLNPVQPRDWRRRLVTISQVANIGS